MDGLWKTDVVNTGCSSFYGILEDTIIRKKEKQGLCSNMWWWFSMTGLNLKMIHQFFWPVYIFCFPRTKPAVSRLKVHFRNSWRNENAVVMYTTHPYVILTQCYFHQNKTNYKEYLHSFFSVEQEFVKHCKKITWSVLRTQFSPNSKCVQETDQ